jgi:hypothetical protein
VKLVFGRNRRQHPLVVACPGGEVRISREFGGAVRVQVVAGDGSVEVRSVRPHVAELGIAYSEMEAADVESH